MGASAGGLDAFKRFFSAMPADSGMAFVLVQHLAPEHESLTADILTKHTAMKVAQVEDKIAIEPNHVYVIPPNTNLSIRSGVLYLSAPAQPHGHRLPIDFFFRSLAEDQEAKALCIILSGTGRDGTLGLKAIKGHGGMAIAQSPETAQFDGMPRSAIDTGLIDYVLPVAEMPAVLIDYLQHARGLIGPETLNDNVPDLLELILATLRERTKHDFHYYKTGTLVRRIKRRMGLNHIEEVGDYLRFLREDEHEPQRLRKDFLIGVTRFFREPEANQLLEQEVIRKLVQEKKPEAPIRVWVPGCSSGEEAYSIAILLLEQAQALQKPRTIQIFASDIDEEALATARAGIYPENIAADISPERLRQFFRKVGQNNYEVSTQVRDCVVFAAQDLISDPPFSRLDLISCRNLLIYIVPEVQKKVISLFHYVLNEGGFLFLGASETIGQQEDLFKPVSKKLRVYQRLGPTRRDKVDFPVSNGRARPTSVDRQNIQPRSVKSVNFGNVTQALLLQHYAPFAVLFNRKFEILYLHGPSGPYLELTTGDMTQDLMSMIRDGLRGALRNAVKMALQQAQQITLKARVKRDGTYYPIALTVLPVSAPQEAEGLLLATFADVEATSRLEHEWIKGEGIGDEAFLGQLESELQSTRAELQGTISELETSNEELKSYNEEILSMNEELQSANEELETSKEELQSLNEELATVNNQLQDKLDELRDLNNDQSNLLTSTDIATLFLDTQLRIKRFTPAISKIFNLIASDVGRPIGDIAQRVHNSTLQADADVVLRTLTPIEKQIGHEDDRWYLQRVLPYRTEDNKIEGVVVTFIDITERNRAQQVLQKTKNYLQLLLASTGEAMYGVDKQGHSTFINPKFTELLGYTQAELSGKRVHDLIHHTHIDGTVYPWQESVLYKCLTQGESYHGDNEVIWRKDGTSFPAFFTVAPLIEDEGVTGAVVALRDITEAHEMSRELEQLARHDSLTGLINRREFEHRLARVIESTEESNIQHALCFLDLDQFKLINDTCGHLAGDELLQQIAALLKEHVRKRDTIARLGGDEFGLLMEHCDIEEAGRVANTLLKVIAEYRFMWEGKPYTVGISIGVALITEDTGDMTVALKAADAACYAAKEAGRNRIHIYHEQDLALSVRHGEMRWVMKINSALEENRFHLDCQPIVAIDATNDVKPIFEFLLRLEDDDGEIILPETFLKAAVRYNLSIQLDQWVLSTALAWLNNNPKQFKEASLFTINLSAPALGDDGFLNFTLAELRKHGVSPDKICFEITETAAISNLANTNKFIHALKELGCRFAIDDFGAGLSSFGYLKALAVEYLKISGLFVANIMDDPIDLAMVKSINEVGHVMGKKTIAKFTENEAILAKLRELGVDYAQGDVIGKPVRVC
ncbi:hypothetical protein BI364_09295 [Acidihalobacter yilgarnensis]|uniref:Chemotaxis protein CheR n=2 Tax=Acidihalobacter yilgarnensis TaxID=2819280 RepID=A0A1D8INU0_9GAMM|nr:hypothetical protein BI364_09295 [Acidihalobacter yilgarnensis]